MAERLVDVKKRGSRLLHTFPVTTPAPPTEEEPYKQKALEAAATQSLSRMRNSKVSTPGSMPAAAAS
jgi:hypothetical protein